MEWSIYQNNSDFRAIRGDAGSNNGIFEAMVALSSDDGTAEVFHGVIFLSDYTDEELQALIAKSGRSVSALRSMDTAMLVAETQPGRTMPRSRASAFLQHVIPERAMTSAVYR